MHEDDMNPNVRTKKKEKVRQGDPKTLLECHVGEVVLLAIRVCRFTAGPGGTVLTGAFVDPYDRENDLEIHELICIQRNVPVETDHRQRDLVKLLQAVKHLLPRPDDVSSKGDASALRQLNRCLLDLE